MIAAYFAQIKATLDQYAATPFVLDASVTFDVRPGDQGYLSGYVIFTDGFTLHFKEFVDADQGVLEKLTYSYHYQSSEDTLIFRYDNARHKPPLAFHEHKHLALGTIVAAAVPLLGDVLAEISQLKAWV